MEAWLTTTLDKFEQYIHQAFSAYTEKEQIRMLKNEIKILKEENSKLKYDMSEKKSNRNIKWRKGETNVANGNPANVKTSTTTKCTTRNEKLICSTSKHSRWSAR